MKNLFKLELKFDRDITMMTIISTIVIIVDRYHVFAGHKAIDRVALYLLLPLMLIIFLERRSPSEYGFGVGDWKAGLVITALSMIVIAPVLYFTARGNMQMQAYYGGQLTPAMPLLTFLDLIGWEFFFRGWLLFGYGRKYEDDALWLQAVPFALAHIGKPEVETLSTIFGGFVFGLIAWRTRSFLYPFLIHWFVSSFTILVAAGVFG